MEVPCVLLLWAGERTSKETPTNSFWQMPSREVTWCSACCSSAGNYGPLRCGHNVDKNSLLQLGNVLVDASWCVRLFSFLRHRFLSSLSYALYCFTSLHFMPHSCFCLVLVIFFYNFLLLTIWFTFVLRWQIMFRILFSSLLMLSLNWLILSNAEHVPKIWEPKHSVHCTLFTILPDTIEAHTYVINA